MARNRYPLPRIRKQRQSPVRRWLELLSYASVVVGILLIMVVLYLEYSAPETLIADPPAPPPAETAESAARALPEPETVPHQAEPATRPAPLPEDAYDDDDSSGVAQGVIAAGDTAGSLLQQWLEPSEVSLIIEACKPVHPLSRLGVGQPYAAYFEKRELVHFEYEIDRDKQLIVTRQIDPASGKTTWLATLEPIQYEVRLARVTGEIDESLFESVAKAGERPALAVRLAEIFAWEINFIRDIQSGDSFRVLIEKRYRDGEEKAYGAILAAEFVNQGSKFEAYRHADGYGKHAYFNAMGDSLRRAFLKAPLAFNRISSHFNPRRLHPILRQIRPHPAVDYAAPSGTPVKAIGNGTVAFRGWGKGAGNYITLKHHSGYESMYLHLSGFAKGLKKGARVRQGEIIGYVGSTGYSTGPHLDFRMKKNGKFVNPEKILSPRDEAVPKKDMKDFRAKRDLYRDFLDGKKNLLEYDLAKD
jgi:murein DD-endopeptidase MepM/ murein hydrolase activator NlpD